MVAGRPHGAERAVGLAGVERLHRGEPRAGGEQGGVVGRGDRGGVGVEPPAAVAARALDHRHELRGRAPGRARRRWPGAAPPCATASPKPGRLDARQHGSEPVGSLRVPTPEVVVEVALVGQEEGGHDLATLGRPGTVAPMTGHRLLPGTDPRLRVAPWRGDTHVAHLTPGRGRPTLAAVHRADRRPRRRRLHERAHRRARPVPTSSRSCRPGSRSTSGSTCSSAPSTTCPPSAPADLRRGHHADRASVLERRRRRVPVVLAARRPRPRRRAGRHAERPVPGRHRPRGGRASWATPSRAGPGRAATSSDSPCTPTTSGPGLGGALVVDGLRWLRRWGAKEVLVNTQEGNEPAVRLYEALGFELRPDGLAVLRLALGEAS